MNLRLEISPSTHTSRNSVSSRPWMRSVSSRTVRGASSLSGCRARRPRPEVDSLLLHGPPGILARVRSHEGEKSTMRSRVALLPGLLIGVVIGVLVAGGTMHVLSQGTRNEALPRAVTPRGPLAEDERSMIGLFHKASVSVVYITTRARQMDFWTRNVFEVPQGTGSGFVWDEQGHVVTNYHVVQGADKAEVALGEEAYEATFVGGAPDQDLAVLKIGARQGKARPHQGRHQRGHRGGAEGLRHRQPLRPRPHPHHRHRERAGPDHPERDQPAHRRASSRPTPPSTPATPGGRCSTARAGSSGSTPRSTAPRAPPRASASRCPSTP